ncbi:MAG: PD-(D/E)XK nuclease family protein [Campylobacterota bacterium]|nr:PD-(D/E)XK nuclease family protein [Campylobacterota bacterium]
MPLTKYNNNSTLLVFPTSRAIRACIDAHKSTNQLLPKCISIGDFFSNIISIGNKQFCEPELRILYLKEALKNIDIESLGMDKDFSTLLKQSDYIFRFFSELSSEGKKISDLYEMDTYAYYHDHLDILQEIYTQYIAILDRHNMVDKINLPQEYALNVPYIEQYDEIILYYEGYFSAHEFELVQSVAARCSLSIHFTQTKFNVKNLTMFEKFGLCLHIDHHYCIDITEQKIVHETPIEVHKQNISVEPLGQRINQIGLIKHSIVEMVKQGIDPVNIVVLLPDESFHVMLKLFDNEHYFNFAMGESIQESLLMKVGHAIYKILIDYEPKDHDKIMRYNLNHELINQTFKTNLNKRLDKTVYTQLIDLLLAYETRKELLDKIEVELLGLEKLLFHHSVKINFKDAFKIILQKLGQITLDDVKGGKITVMGLLETRALSFEGVIVVDFNDHIIPKRSVKDKFISTSIKKLVGLPTPKDREDLQKYYYAQLFSNAKMIHIGYVDDEQSGLSRFAHEIFDEKVILKYGKNYDNILYQAKEVHSWDENIVLDIDLSLKEWSATSLKIYLQCKRQYYFKYIKKIQEHFISLKPQGFEMGSILHKALELMYQNLDRSQSKEEFIQALNGLIDQGVGKNSYLILDAQIWKRKLSKFVQLEFERFSQGAKPIALEQTFKIKHQNIVLKGSIDRIDRLANDELLVLDYKTSSMLKIDTVKNYEKSDDFQLEFYYVAVQEMFGVDSDIQCCYYDLHKAQLKDEVAMDPKLLRLEKILDELKTSTVNFEKCEDKKACEYCAYKIMCGR